MFQNPINNPSPFRVPIVTKGLCPHPQHFFRVKSLLLLSSDQQSNKDVKMMEPSEYKERNVMEGNFIRNFKVNVRRQDSTQDTEVSLGNFFLTNKVLKCLVTGTQKMLISVFVTKIN